MQESQSSSTFAADVARNDPVTKKCESIIQKSLDRLHNMVLEIKHYEYL